MAHLFLILPETRQHRGWFQSNIRNGSLEKVIPITSLFTIPGERPSKPGELLIGFRVSELPDSADESCR